MGIDTVVLVSIGRHPASGRARRADADARAVELALNSGADPLEAVHAGDPAHPALAGYLGMGIGRLTVLDLPPEADPVPALGAHLAERRPGLILAGARAEAGEDSGLVPYLLAEALGYALAPGIVAVTLEEERISMVQAVPGGGRRVLSAPPPLIATVADSAPPARGFALAKARRGRVEAVAATAAADPQAAAWERRPARKRPRRLTTAGGGSAAERLRAATRLAGGGGKVLSGLDAEEAARQILDFLSRESLI